METEQANIGVTIYYDGDFPDLCRCEAIQGAEVIVRPSALLCSFEIWDITNRAHAYGDHLYLAACSAVGPDAGGILLGKLVRVLSGCRVNPLVGAAAITAFPMSGRLVQEVAWEEDDQNFLLMHALGANTAGKVASVTAAAVLMALVFPLPGRTGD